MSKGFDPSTLDIEERALYLERQAALAQMRRQHGSKVTDAFARMRELDKNDEVDREEMFDIVQGLLNRGQGT